MRKNNITWYSVALIGSALFLLVVHTLQLEINGHALKVDTVSVVLLILLALPVISQYIDTIKAGDIEFTMKSLKKLSISDQLFMFLESLSAKGLWTLYPQVRFDERNLGPAFKSVLDELLVTDKSQLQLKVGEWLKSGDENLIWMASEIIGYYELTGFEEELLKIFRNINIDKDWTEAQLNCKWAYSRLTGWEHIHDFLIQSKNKFNQKWLLDVYLQMPKEQHADIGEFRDALVKFLKNSAIDQEVRKKAEKVEKELSLMLTKNTNMPTNKNTVSELS